MGQLVDSSGAVQDIISYVFLREGSPSRCHPCGCKVRFTGSRFKLKHWLLTHAECGGQAIFYSQTKRLAMVRPITTKQWMSQRCLRYNCFIVIHLSPYILFEWYGFIFSAAIKQNAPSMIRHVSWMVWYDMHRVCWHFFFMWPFVAARRALTLSHFLYIFFLFWGIHPLRVLLQRRQTFLSYLFT